MLRTGVLRMNASPEQLRSASPAGELWRSVDAQLRPFIAKRVDAADVDDVLQDVFVRMQRGLGQVREEERFSGWLFQVARTAIAEHGRARARHPLPKVDVVEDAPAGPSTDDDRVASRALSGCVAVFVARLATPYREAVTLVELEGLTAREAAEIVGISVSGMKSRVQRGRQQLREMMEACCEIALDARGKVTDFAPRVDRCACGST
ncbi:MAG TPA: sigma-70 family RNA polymerase sigma factor [Kofleriaceae bacterium]|nr:sigma-70 family RNA polymerase sigma factor [Kofleriaceae bacterium]